VSTTSSRSTWALRLSLSIRTVLNNTPHSARRPSPDGYLPFVEGRAADPYASGVGRKLIGLFWRPALKQPRIFFIDLDECPSADNLRLVRRLEKGGSGSSGLEFKRPAADAASGGWQWLYA
jgi:hypothetical protein